MGGNLRHMRFESLLNRIPFPRDPSTGIFMYVKETVCCRVCSTSDFVSAP